MCVSSLPPSIYFLEPCRKTRTRSKFCSCKVKAKVSNHIIGIALQKWAEEKRSSRNILNGWWSICPTRGRTLLRRTVTMRKITHDSARHGGRPCYCRHTANGMWVRGARVRVSNKRKQKKNIRFVLLLLRWWWFARVKSCSGTYGRWKDDEMEWDGSKEEEEMNEIIIIFNNNIQYILSNKIIN